MSSELSRMDENRLIARLLIGKPEITLTEIRHLVPGTRMLNDHALSQKVDHMRRVNAKSRPLANRDKRGAKQ
ncbi:MAG: hypothetical protein ACK4UZ_13445 [Rhizobium rhizophilum]